MKILITGASSGLGAELARRYASQENELFLLARREDRLQKLKYELLPKTKQITLIPADVTQFQSLQKKIDALGVLDMVILNAGVSLGHSDDIASIEAFKYLYDVNVLANHAILEILLPKFCSRKR